MLDEVCHGGQRGIENHIIIYHLKNPVCLVQPFRDRHVGIINGAQVPDERLEEIMMGIDEPRVNDFVCGVDGLIMRVCQILAQLGDLFALDEDVSMKNDTVLGVAGHNSCRIFNQNRPFHTAPLFRISL